MGVGGGAKRGKNKIVANIFLYTCNVHVNKKI